MLPPAPPSLQDLGPGLRRLIAPNPSPMTYWGTNTYILGKRKCAVIDPGPDDPDHCAAILGALPEGAHVSHILVTHAHIDHSPGSRLLARQTGAPVYAFGPPEAGRSAIMQGLANEGLAGGGEGVDYAFEPDDILRDGDVLRGADWELRALHTPGHMGNHLAFAWDDMLFCGDLVMGWSSSLVSPPDGDLTDFMASCRRLKDMNWAVLHAGHGLPIEAPNERLSWLIAHRLERESQIKEALGEQSSTATEIAQAVYHDLSPALLPAAARNVFAHLIDLTARGLAAPTGPLGTEAEFTLTVS